LLEFTHWPADKKRLERYWLYEQLYDGEHADAFEAKLKKPIKNAAGDGLTWLEFDYPRMIVDVSTNLLVGEPPVISYEDDELNEALRKVMERSRFGAALLEVAQSAAMHGDSVMVTRMTEEGVVVEPKPAYCYFPEQNPDNCREVLSEQLAWVREYADTEVLRVDRYTPGEITREAYWMDGPKVGLRIFGPDLEILLDDEPETIQTGLSDRNNLVHVPNQRKASDLFGRSDLGGGLPSLFEEINWRASQISVILDRHADPKMSGPKISRPPGSDPRKPIDLSEHSYIEVTDGTSLPQYLIWDAQLISATAQYERCKAEILRHSETAAVLAGEIKGARFDSARAYRIQLAPTLAKNSRKRTHLDPAIKEILRIAVAIELRRSYADTPPPNVKWRDGLPKDTSEASQTENNRIASKTTSRLSAIRRLDDCDEQTAMDELARIEDEHQKFGGVELITPPQQDPDEETETDSEGSEDEE
jgi:SPP1 Gp6-like portal protein